MSVVAKVRVHEVVNRGAFGEGDQRQINNTVKMAPVVVGDTELTEEDTHFSAATPSGMIELAISNPEAAEQFQPGDTFYVRFEKAPA